MLSELRQRDRAKRDAEARMQPWLIDDLTDCRTAGCWRIACRKSGEGAARKPDGGVALHRHRRLQAGQRQPWPQHRRCSSGSGGAARAISFRQSDTLARIGSDEFTLILDHVQSGADAEKAAESVWKC